MGCDIHPHLEILTKEGWIHYSIPQIQRNYSLFGKMAGVRGNTPPISLPRGLPSNLSIITQIEAAHWNSDGHSHSWLCRDEIRKVIDFHNNQEGYKWIGEAEHKEWGYICGNAIWSTENIPEEYLDVRLVFWFDN